MARNDSIKKMQQILIQRRDALRKVLAGDLGLRKEFPEQSGGDMVDVALDAAQDELSSQLAEVESRELMNIERALDNIRQGTYGMCEVCSTKISLARLQALPYATMCIECQRAAESGELEGRGESNWGRVIDTGYSDADVSINDFELQ